MWEIENLQFTTSYIYEWFAICDIYNYNYFEIARYSQVLMDLGKQVLEIDNLPSLANIHTQKPDLPLMEEYASRI